MVVDDSAIMRKNLTTILTQAGHTVVGEAINGGQAHLLYRTHMPDLVTMDITMPGVNGIEAVKLIKKDFPDAKIVMVSALDQRNMVLEALKLGAKHYIVKPITAETVISIINKVLCAQPQQEAKNSGSNQDSSNSQDAEGSSEERKESQQEPEKPFTIENVEGTLKISLSSQLNDDNILGLEQALQGLLFIQPLKVLFNFGNTSKVSEKVLQKISDMVQKIRGVNGLVNVISNNGDFVNYVKSQGITTLIELIEKKS